jgi:hypothetical protein
MAEDSRVQELNKLFEQAKSPKARLEPDWYLNVAYYYGEQWVFWNHGRIDKPKLEEWRIMLVDNRIMPANLARVARKVKNKPQFVVTPTSLDEDDLNSAELGEAILENDWSNLHLQQKLFNALMWAEVASAGFWKIYWDKTEGDYKEDYVFDPQGQAFPNPQTGRPLRADEGEQILGIEGFEAKPVSMGDVKVEVLSPFNIFPDPLAEIIEDCEFIIEENVRSAEYIKKHYGEEIEPDTDVPIGIAESRMFPFITDKGGAGDYRGISVYELYAKPSSKYGAEGKRVIWTKNKVLLEETLENSPFSGCPYVMFSGIKVPGRFWPTSITSQLRGPQTELNKIESQIRENALRIGNPSLLSSRQSNVAYSGLPGEKVFFDSTTPDAAPSFLQPPEMPVYVQNEVDRITSSITEISGLHEVSKANVPSGVTAASAINLLQEADDTRLGPEIQDLEEGLGKAGTKILKLRAQYQDDNRTIQAAGEDGEWNVTEFRGAILKKNTNVQVQAGSAMPRSKAAKQAAMQEILAMVLQYGLEVRPRDLRKFLREFGVGGLEQMFSSLQGDEQHVRRENNLMKNGTAIDINDFDDDDVHIEGHNELRKSKWYFAASKDLKKIIDVHVMSHMERRQATIDAQIEANRREMIPIGGNGAAQ